MKIKTLRSVIVSAVFAGLIVLTGCTGSSSDSTESNPTQNETPQQEPEPESTTPTAPASPTDEVATTEDAETPDASMSATDEEVGQLEGILELTGGAEAQSVDTTETGSTFFVSRLLDGAEDILTVDSATAEIVASTGDVLENRDDGIDSFVADPSGESVFALVYTGEKKRKLFTIESATGTKTDEVALRDNYGGLTLMNGSLFMLSANFLGEPRSDPLSLAKVGTSDLSVVDELALGESNREFAVLACPETKEVAVEGYVDEGSKTLYTVAKVQAEPLQTFEVITRENSTWPLDSVNAKCDNSVSVEQTALSTYSLEDGALQANLDLKSQASSDLDPEGFWKAATFSPDGSTIFALLKETSSFSLVLLQATDLTVIGSIPIPDSVVNPATHKVRGNLVVSGDGTRILANFQQESAGNADKVLSFEIF